ncbi:uncharacterized protein LOC108667988 [Hyalella azteca]|uniref:NADH dehydrogenase [ubiquinone] 1 alpha subcomplex assembly factor 3 n=1 Tax=Hyalella azteca TaxID=294128 RepID=A0A8B7NAI2_HYAAZ|nr:uncharacterized protein LOC108667988 [Hyalella azteca]
MAFVKNLQLSQFLQLRLNYKYCLNFTVFSDNLLCKSMKLNSIHCHSICNVLNLNHCYGCQKVPKNLYYTRTLLNSFHHITEKHFISNCCNLHASHVPVINQKFINFNYGILRKGLEQEEGCAKFHTDEDRTIVTFLNREESAPLMVNSYSQRGFRLNNGLAVVGAIALFPKSLLSWNVTSAAKINRESLSLFYMLAPKIDLLVLGVGDRGSKFDLSLLPFMSKKGISLEVLPTEKAVSTYNFLVEEGRCVAGAFVPPQTIVSPYADHAAALMRRKEMFQQTLPDEFI